MQGHGALASHQRTYVLYVPPLCAAASASCMCVCFFVRVADGKKSGFGKEGGGERGKGERGTVTLPGQGGWCVRMAVPSPARVVLCLAGTLRCVALRPALPSRPRCSVGQVHEPGRSVLYIGRWCI